LIIKKYTNNTKIVDCLRFKCRLNPQTKLKEQERMENLKNKIEIEEKFKRLINRMNIILVDDVMTTGSTLNECSKMLKREGAKNICCLVLAKNEKILLNKYNEQQYQ
jgi:predicted amidophosphoribosyltransferase